MIPAVQFIAVQIFRNKILQMHKSTLSHLKLQNIIFIMYSTVAWIDMMTEAEENRPLLAFVEATKTSFSYRIDTWSSPPNCILQPYFWNM